MAGVVYLKTNHFEVKLEGITFKPEDFGRLCSDDFLFPEGKVWVQTPIVGIDIIRHPCDPSIVLVILCFGLGCVILRFHLGAALPEQIHIFFTDKRIRFVGFAIPEKSDLFPFDELGLIREKTDIGYLAAEHFDNPTYIKSDLGALARKILGIKRMFGLTQVSYFERHEQIKSAVCQLFITTVLAMSLFNKGENVKTKERMSFQKNLSSMSLLTEGWFKLQKGRKEEKNDSPETPENDKLYDVLLWDIQLIQAYNQIEQSNIHSSQDNQMENTQLFIFSNQMSSKSDNVTSWQLTIRLLMQLLCCR